MDFGVLIATKRMSLGVNRVNPNEAITDNGRRCVSEYFAEGCLIIPFLHVGQLQLENAH